MRVLMVTGSYPPQPCGVGNYSQRLVQELQTAGIEVDVATTASRMARNEPSVRLEVPNWHIGTWRKALSRIPSRTYDIAHVQYPARYYGYLPDLAFLVFVLKRALGSTPIVVTLHEFSITHPFRKLTVGAITTPASAVTLTTASEQKPLLRWFPWLRPKVRIIHMAPSIPLEPVSEGRRREIRSKLGVDDGEQVLVYFGLLHPNKGVKKLIEAFGSNLLSNKKLKLLFLSHFDPLSNDFHAELQAQVRARSLESKVIWAGFLDDATSSEYIGASDMACLPFEDGVTLRRLSFMATMGLGKPTITTEGDIPVASLGIVPGEHALVLPASCSSEDLGKTIGLLSDTPELRKRLSRQGIVWASQYRWETVVEETTALYNDLQQRRRS